MSRKAVLTFRKISDNSKRRLLIVDGVVVNPQVEEEVRADMNDFEQVRLRRSGEPVKELLFVADGEEVYEVVRIPEATTVDQV